jgi:hypothetical protein
MLTIIRDEERHGFAICASPEFSEHILKLSVRNRLTLEETLSRALLPSIAEAIRLPDRPSEEMATLVDQALEHYRANS